MFRTKISCKRCQSQWWKQRILDGPPEGAFGFCQSRQDHFDFHNHSPLTIKWKLHRLPKVCSQRYCISSQRTAKPYQSLSELTPERQAKIHGLISWDGMIANSIVRTDIYNAMRFPCLVFLKSARKFFISSSRNRRPLRMMA